KHVRVSLPAARGSHPRPFARPPATLVAPSGAALAGTGGGPAPGFGVHVLGDPAEVRPERVITAACVRVRQHLVGLRGLLEALLGRRVMVDVRVMGAGELAVGTLDLLLARRAANAKHLVEVAG